MYVENNIIHENFHYSKKYRYSDRIHARYVNRVKVSDEQLKITRIIRYA